jgi:hypothetical protein
VESSSEFGIEPSHSIKCWETIECPNNREACRVVLSSIELGDVGFLIQKPTSPDLTRNRMQTPKITSIELLSCDSRGRTIP